MQSLSEENVTATKIVDFGSVPVDTITEKYIAICNDFDRPVAFRVSLAYILNTVDSVFDVSVTSAPVNPKECVNIKATFRPKVVGQTFTEYYVVDDAAGNVYRLKVTGKCFGPDVILDQTQLFFSVCKNVSELRTADINIVNRTKMDITYQWLLPVSGQGYFQIANGNCGLVRACETITITVVFTGNALGVYTAELVCLVLHQAPLFVNSMATVILPGNTFYDISDHKFHKNSTGCRSYERLMMNSLNRLRKIPCASVFERYLDFGTGSVKSLTKNISKTLCVTNHEQEEGYIQWMLDPDNVFVIDPIASVIPANESRLFTVRFRPKTQNEVYGYLFCGDYQYKRYPNDSVELRHTWFRIPCIGNTWSPCTRWNTEWSCPVEAILPPTVPTRTTFSNFMLSNKLEIPMYFKFDPPNSTNFVVMPMCGIVPSRGWQIISVALEPKTEGEYFETWDLIINREQKARVCLIGNAEVSTVEIMSHGYNPHAHGLYEFPPTITGCTNYCTAYLHNITRMEIHVRILSHVDWLGADECGSVVLPPREIVRYRWWFFPKVHDMVYNTTVTCSCVCLINGRPVGEPTEMYINIFGFSENPDLRVLPKLNNLHDIVVGENRSCSITLYNYGTCFFTSKLYHTIDGLDDDFSGDKFLIDTPVNSLKPSTHCQVNLTVTPDGAGSRQVNLKYTVLYRTEFDEVEEIQPITKTICIVWYDGIYPTIQIKRSIAVRCPVILSNYCVRNVSNVEELNKALLDCRPNKPLHVDIYAPDLCMDAGDVELIFVMGCVYRTAPVTWSMRREKICDCKMLEVQIGFNFYEKKHTCPHRALVEITPMNGFVSIDSPCLVHMIFHYEKEGRNRLCYILSLPNNRSIYLYINICSLHIAKGVLAPLQRPTDNSKGFLAVLDCGKISINNLDPVIRITWLYNPTDVFTTWRLLRGNTCSSALIRCLLFFAEVPPLGKLAIPFSFLPKEMIDYEMEFSCSFGYDTMKILVKGQGGLPNCLEPRLDLPPFVEKNIRAAYREHVVYLSTEHLTLRVMPTHSVSREIICICNDTDHLMRFIWIPERISNIANIVMTPCWGVLQPNTSEWITMTVYTLQEPATFTTVVACEILDLTERRAYQRNELLRKNKAEKCKQEFIITEEGFFRPELNDSPPYVLDIAKPEPSYLAMTLSVATKGQRDEYPRMLIKQMWEHPPPYDMSSINPEQAEKGAANNSLTLIDILRIMSGILWSALHSKMFRHQMEFYVKEEIPTKEDLVKEIDTKRKMTLSKRVTSGICDAIANKAIFNFYGLTNKRKQPVLEAE